MPRATTTLPESLDRRQLLAALRAFQRGEFSTRLPDTFTGVDGDICKAFNAAVQQAEALSTDLSSLNDALRTEGRTAQRLRKPSGRGQWATMNTSVNETLDALALQRQDVLRVINAIALGDLTQRVDLEGPHGSLKGDFARTATSINKMVESISSIITQLIGVSQDVGVEGKLGAQARIIGVSGAWKELTDSVNLMASSLTRQVREIARVTTAVAQGDLSKTVNIEVRGEVQELKTTINTMVTQLSAFAAEVSRVAREVGTEGKLGGQARVTGVSGVWFELTENVNSMAQNLTQQVRNIAEVSSAIAAGDLSKKITVSANGEIFDLKTTINTMVDQLGAFSSEVSRVARDVGTDGLLGVQAEASGASGVWRELTENVNSMAQNLTDQVRNVAEVVTAIAQGDLSKKITVDARGEILALKETINATVDKLNSFSSEVTRVARLVGTEGTLGVQADVQGVSGVWKELTDNVNLMGRNLTDQVRDIAHVTTAVANGDLSHKITVEVRGELLTLKSTINAMVDSLSSFADEVTRMAREVGTEGTLGGQAEVPNVSGIWKELTDNVNSMANNLTNQVRNISDVAGAVARGDLSRKITVNARGEVQDLKNTINTMVDRLNSFVAEVTRVAREVGTEGKLGGQASIGELSGSWRELTENVNLMANALTLQVRDIAVVTTAVAKGDLTRKITVDARGEILELKSTINTMVDELGTFAGEVMRLANEVGIEGRLGGQADVRGLSGTWRALTDGFNLMANNLTQQVRNISQVASAIAEGDLRKKIVVDARGEIQELKNTINTMVDQLRSLAEEVTRVAREVGTEGKLGGQATVAGMRGDWKELADNVNQMASNLTDQVRDIASVSSAIAAGNLSRKITVEVRGEIFDLKTTINTMVDQLSAFAAEVTQLARDVGEEGKLGGRARVSGASGIWRELTENVNLLTSNLTHQVRDIAAVTTAVANGDLTKKIAVEVKGEILELKNTINTMVDQLSSFASEVTRVAREVGTEGRLGGQAEVRDVSGTWRELTDNVNIMAENLTGQVRGIARVVTAVANGDLKQQLTLDAQGEIATLVSTINDMIVTLSTFADQVTGVARDVGVEGKLGGQADVPGAAGIWRELTNNVNELASNLTRQVRAIGDVATAVTKGDLTQAITVEARGELAVLKDNLNQMILELAKTTRANEQQDWLKTNLARFTRMLQGQRDLLSVAKQVLSELAPVVGAQFGAFYMARKRDDRTVLQLFASYAYKDRKNLSNVFELGEGLVGQAAMERSRICVDNVPPAYVAISSGLGEATPITLVVVPIVFESEVKGVIELASFKSFSRIELDFLDQLLESLGIVVATIEATMRTDELLRQSQGLTEELQAQQEELQQTNEELEEKAKQLTQQKQEVEAKNQQIEIAKEQLEEKAKQLALTSKYKSQFLANMSHELRTPLNSLLILSKQLAANRNATLNEKEVAYAQNIHQAGSDLLSLINEILDLAKIESGTLSAETAPVHVEDVSRDLDRMFRQIAEDKGIAFSVNIEEETPAIIQTDELRLKQVLRNLLANAFKFTEKGHVELKVEPVSRPGGSSKGNTDAWISFSVTDTGIGIPKDKHNIVFEAFQQVDGGPNRRYGGTGLGLSISREIAGLLGGNLSLQSELGKGSCFTLIIPIVPEAVAAVSSSREHRHHALPTKSPFPGEARGTKHPSNPPSVRVSTNGSLTDDRDMLKPGDRVVLIIEDDVVFAEVLLNAARETAFKGVVATTGAEGLSLAVTLQPDAITLDLLLPDVAGWVVLDRLKHHPETRHIPVQVISGADQRRRSLETGAIAFLRKPVEELDLKDALSEIAEFIERRVKRLLVVEDDEIQRQNILSLVENTHVEVVAVRDAEEALTRLDNDEHFDCMVTDLQLPGISGFELLDKIKERPKLRRLPIIVYTARELSHVEETGLRRLADTIIVKDARSPERLLEETTLFLHQVEASLPEEKLGLLRRGEETDPTLVNKTILVVDDDMRNVFAITAVLERYEMHVVFAENGLDALKKIKSEPRIDAVLMDIMMPEMDGYEATRRIRKEPGFETLPIIALTAKAMQGDREKCLECGASDYITKPVDSDQLISLLRVWLYQ